CKVVSLRRWRNGQSGFEQDRGRRVPDARESRRTRAGSRHVGLQRKRKNTRCSGPACQGQKIKNEGETSMRIRFAALITALLLSPLLVSSCQTAPGASSPATSTSDGKPDFSGLWRAGPAGARGERQASIFQGGSAPLRKTRIQLAQQLPLTAKGKELVAEYTKGDGKFGGETGAPGDPRYHTIPCGPASPGSLTADVELVQNPKR